MSGIMEIIDARESKNKQRQKEAKDGVSYNGSVRAKCFCFAFKLGFIREASLIFKSNLELNLTIILKQRELYESKHVAVKCRCLKIYDLLSLLICS